MRDRGAHAASRAKAGANDRVTAKGYAIRSERKGLTRHSLNSTLPAAGGKFLEHFSILRRETQKIKTENSPEGRKFLSTKNSLKSTLT